MRRALALAVVLLVGCSSSGDVHEIVVSPRAAPGRERRFELVATCSLEPTRDAELWLPLASTEAGAQVVELVRARISPAARHEVETDSLGNRVLHVRRKGAGKVEIEVVQHVRRVPVRPTVGRVEPRTLSDQERVLLAPDLASADEDLAELAKGYRPARRREGFLAQSPGTRVRWAELYLPGAGWTPSFPGLEEGELPDELVLVATKTSSLPRALVDGATVDPRLAWRTREIAEERE